MYKETAVSTPGWVKAHTVIGLAEALGLAAVAEGVETAEQVAELRAVGCRYVQGFYFARPMPPERLGKVLAAGRRL
jgi:EAL domain-containing protein (putative c-di-GMP-specific phosphodiesterase class I)